MVGSWYTVIVLGLGFALVAFGVRWLIHQPWMNRFLARLGTRTRRRPAYDANDQPYCPTDRVYLMEHGICPQCGRHYRS